MRGIFPVTREAGSLPAWFVLLLAVNALAALIYWLWCHFRKKGPAGGYRLRVLVMLLCPLAGPLFFGFSWVYYRLFFHKPVDLDDVIFNKDRTETFIKADENAERDVVPLEEAIAITDQSSTRALMMDVVRRDISHSLSTISMALGSEDSEVSHYAASVLQETMNNLRVSFQKLYRHIRELEEEVAACDEPDNPLRLLPPEEAPEEETQLWSEDTANTVEGAERENAAAVSFYREEQRRRRNKAEAYRQGLLARDGVPEPGQGDIMDKLAEEMEDAHGLLTSLHQVLQQKVFSALEQQTYTDMMQELGELIDRREVLAVFELEALAAATLELNRYEVCDAWCSRSAVLYPLALSSFTCRLKLCFATENRAGFFKVLEELKASDVTLDHETLEMIRVFL